MVDDAIQGAGNDFVQGLGVVLSVWVQEAANAGRQQEIGRFHSACPPRIGIQDYIKRLRRHFGCSDACFVLALVYMDRLGSKHPAFGVCDVTVHRLLTVALMMAAKFLDDEYFSNAHYAKAGGLAMKEANLLESIMLKGLDWKMHVTPEDYQLYHSLVCKALL
jgi:hypothetical protein